MSATLLRRKYNRQFINLDRLGATAAWSLVIFYVSVIVVGVLFGHILLKQQASIGSVLAFLGIMILIGTRLRGLNNIVHECSHATFTRSRAQNELIGKFCASLTLTSFKNYRDEHLSHHAHLGDPKLDRDFHDIEPLRLDEPIQTKTIIRHIVTPLIGRHLPYYLRIDFSDSDGIGFKWFRVSLVFAGVALAAAEPVTGVLLILVPFMFIFTTLNYWADCIDHAGIIGSQDDLEASRNVLAPSFVRVLFFPRHDCYHLVHHLFPCIPAQYLRASHEILKEDPIYASRINAVGYDALSKGAVQSSAKTAAF